ncbi:DNA-processing protein DprA [Rubripirellula lacrimiformis]|uniref:DNA-processing protein DprA n=1 Tax=Rubripirellula lacrimiformis TaxID=1930273 RepID=UPI001C54E6D1|nr:DNA-processing protein DprA [Rubripirellula lacrimiformis]
MSWLVKNQMRPADVLELDDVHDAANAAGVDKQRFEKLLGRGVQLGFAVEEWNRNGIWIVCRSDDDYPTRYRERLKKLAPPILYGVGDKSLMAGGGVAIVGSRNVDAAGEEFAREVAAWCATGNNPVISGGARGVDKTAMEGALRAGGTVVGVLADSLLKTSVSRNARDAIAENQLLLISHCHPKARFTVGTAMGRNKLIYAMADAGLVVSSEYKKGGTWAGAEEELKRKSPQPVFVRNGPGSPIGNTRLQELGAVPFPDRWQDLDPRCLHKIIDDAQSRSLAQKTPLFPVEVVSTDDPPSEATVNGKAKPSNVGDSIPTAMTAYDAVLELLLYSLAEPLTVNEVSERLQAKKNQVQDWLNQAVSESRVVKLTRPTRYQRHCGSQYL